MPLESPSRIRDDFLALEALCVEPVGSSEALHLRLKRILGALSAVEFSTYDVEATRTGAPDLMRAIFNLGLSLRSRVGDWKTQGLVTHDVQKAVRDVLSACRYATDMLGEVHLSHPRLLEEEQPYTGFFGQRINTLVNPAFATGDLLNIQDGDVILMRGTRHNSAAIARIGDVDSQFSHLAIVHIDKAGKPWVVESLIEDGAVVNPFEKSLGHGVGRAVLLRHRDTRLAAEAARFIFERVRKSRRNVLLRIPYDFSMRLEGYRRLFCSKLVRQAFDAASKGRVKLPTFGTRLDMKNRDFFHRIGVAATETFAPADVELEPDFDIVAEWRDYRLTSDLRLQDVLMDKLFEWMDVHGYRFSETLAIRLIGFFGKLASYLSEEAKEMLADVVPKIPRHMKRRTIGTIAMLHKTAEPLFEELKAEEARRIAESGHQLHPREVREFLERRRQELGGEIGYLVAKA